MSVLQLTFALPPLQVPPSQAAPLQWKAAALRACRGTSDLLRSWASWALKCSGSPVASPSQVGGCASGQLNVS